MYKILLAEDEPEVLNSMLDYIQWEKAGFETPVGCRDGRDAIIKLQEGFAPNVVITDICMPFADGLELTRYVNANNPHAIVVILTGYDEFNYAQQAIKLKVFDYVLKPITPGNLYELLGKLKKELDERLLNDMDESMQIVASYFLNRLITKKLENSVIEDGLRLHKLSFPGRYHVVITLDFDLPAPQTVEESNNLELMRYGLFNITQELAETKPDVLVFQGRDGMTKVILGENTPDCCYLRAQALTGLVLDTVKSGLFMTASAGIGDPVAYPDEFHESHAQALDALGHRFFYGESSVICFSDINIKRSGEVDYTELERGFSAAVREVNQKDARAFIGTLITVLKEHHVPFDRCALYSQKLIITLLRLSDEMIGTPDTRPLEELVEKANFYSVSTIGQLEDMLQKICEKAFELFDLVRSDATAAQVMKAESYIRECYQDPSLSLNKVTEHLAISTSYFSAIFKSKTGSTFVEYLTKLRIDKAKQILALSDRRTYEAAEDVGFSDPHYFSVIFKRVTGMTPKEYREKSKAKQ